MTEEQLSTLLRLKRFEQPPQGYFDRLLQDVHRNQRAELLRRPLWKIAFDRIQVFFSEHSMSHVSYAGAMATVLVVGVVGIGLLTPVERAQENAASNLASARISPSSAPSALLSLQSPAAPLALEPRNVSALGQPVITAPRYVIDARPVSYEPSPSFSF